jgi:ethanolamine utilization protein EutP (predicted NTPase)
MQNTITNASSEIKISPIMVALNNQQRLLSQLNEEVGELIKKIDIVSSQIENGQPEQKEPIIPTGSSQLFNMVQQHNNQIEELLNKLIETRAYLEI